MNPKIKELQSFCRHPYAWPGGYPRILVMRDGEVLCVKCAKENYRQISSSTRMNARDGWAIEGVDIRWEGEPEHCINCNADIPSAYGVPDADQA